VTGELSPRDRWLFIALAALVAMVWFSVLAQRPLFNPDEGRYAEIPREMLLSGDWVIPHLNGLEYIEKPPLQYWATAASYAVFGHSELAARLCTGLCAFGCLWLVWLTARALTGLKAAWLAAGVLASMLLFLVLGQLLTLDMTLTFFMSACLVGFLRAQLAAEKGADSRRWMLLVWAALAGGVLTKGVVAGLIPVAVLCIYSVWSRDFSPWRRLQWLTGVPLFLLLTVPWHALAAYRDRDFLEFFFIHEHLQRYLTPEAQRVEPWWFFLAVLAAGSLPWTLAVIRTLATGWRSRAPQGTFNPRRFLWLWVVFTCVFFSISDSKLVPYILPCMPALALLLSMTSEQTLRRDCIITVALTLLFALVLAVAWLRWPQLIASSHRQEYFLPLANSLGVMAALLGLSGLFVVARRPFELPQALLVLGVGWCLSWLLLMRAAAFVAPIYSGLDLARSLPDSARDAPLFSVGTYDQTLPFYLQRQVTLVHFRGELDYGLNKQPEAAIPQLSDFIAQWEASAEAYAIMEKTMFDELKRQNVPIRQLARSADRVMAARR
jgi:4-amino-4-deoxy-L-arabinose transferase-like glycosyltransferase